MNHQDALDYCMSKPGAVPDEPWDGDVVAKVGGKIFAFTGVESIGVKCGRDRDEADELIARWPDAVTAMPYIGRFGWNTICLDGDIPDEDVVDLIDSSYDAIVAKLPKSKRPNPK